MNIIDYIEADPQAVKLIQKLIVLLAKHDSDHLMISHKSGLTAELTIKYPEPQQVHSNELH